MKCKVDAIQSGGGVVAEFFCGLQKPTRFSGGGVVAQFFRGGGVVAQFFRGLLRPTRFSGGGVVAAFSRDLQQQTRRDSVGG